MGLYPFFESSENHTGRINSDSQTRQKLAKESVEYRFPTCNEYFLYSRMVKKAIGQLQKDREAAVLCQILRFLLLRSDEDNLCRADNAEHKKNAEHNQHGQRKISAGILPEVTQKPLCQYTAHLQILQFR